MERRDAIHTARLAVVITDLAVTTTERMVWTQRNDLSIGFELNCPKFEDVGRRHGAPPYNEGDEYRGCRCGKPLGVHRNEVIEASGVWS